MLWLVAGLTAWTGAAAFAELGTAIQRNGGMQEYLQYIYGDGVASTMSLIYLLVIKPSGMAIQSLVFAEYWIHAVVVGQPVWWAEKIIAVAILGAVWALNSLSSRASTHFTDAFLFLKLGTIALIVVLAALAVGVGLNGDGSGASRDWRTGEWFSGAHEEGASGGRDLWDLLGRWSAALYAGLWAYGGWDHVCTRPFLDCTYKTVNGQRRSTWSLPKCRTWPVTCLEVFTRRFQPPYRAIRLQFCRTISFFRGEMWQTKMPLQSYVASHHPAMSHPLPNTPN